MLSVLAEYDDVNMDLNCSCNLEHNANVLKCQGHPFVHNTRTHSEYLCRELNPFKICRLCMQKKTPNYDTKKYYIKKLPNFIENNMVSFEKFLKDLKTDPIFCFEQNIVFCCLGNYSYKEIVDNFRLNPGN